ncbi:MAG: o-succinylbenzoate synthase [Raoultibacter sp.]
MARHKPHDIFFQYVTGNGSVRSFTYEETRFAAAGLALQLRDRGYTRGSAVGVDLPNCPEFIFLALAAAYGGFALVILNHRLTEEEKTDRIFDLRMTGSTDIPVVLDRRAVSYLLENIPHGYDEAYRTEAAIASAPNGFVQPVGGLDVRGDYGGAGIPKRGIIARLFKKESGEQAQDNQRSGRGRRRNDARASAVVDSRAVVNFAERSRASFDRSASALVMFTSGTTGRPKAVSLSWNNLIGSAEASNTLLNQRGEGLWQAALPLFHIGGFQIIVRSLLNETPFLLYRRFDAKRVLADAREYGATHLSVVDKMLQELLVADDGETVANYHALLLGGAAANPVTLRRAVAAGARVFASYGMTETSSQIASCLVTENFDGKLNLLPGYQAHIVNPDEKGIGQLAVRGPGVFGGYLNARTAHTVDGFFLTGDMAEVSDGRIAVCERSGDMFVSGGENVYPAEIQDKLLRVAQVSDAYVFGAEDATWGRRPVAFIERACAADVLEGVPPVFASSVQVDETGAAESDRAVQVENAETLSAYRFAEAVQQSLENRLSKLYQLKHLLVLDEFPRTGIGKIDRAALERRYAERIEIKRVTLYRIDQELLSPFKTAKIDMRSRESIIVEVEDWQGRTGIAECVAFSTDWYLPETLGDDERVLEEILIPLVRSQVFLHPSEVSICFNDCPEADAFPLAKGALEPALWDLYGKIVGKPLWQLIGGAKAMHDEDATSVSKPGSTTLATAEVRAGAVLGILPIDKTLDEVRRSVAAGYERVKLKIKPGDDYERVRAVRAAFPQLTIMLDANQSYIERDMPVLKALDGLGIRCIEEPLDPLRMPPVGPKGLFARLARLQREIRMSVCLDESIVTSDDLDQALKYPELTCFALKIAKFGGVQPALAFYEQTKQRGIEVWMGGMYETGISKRLHAAFETLLGVNIPGDLSETSRYFDQDITMPPFTVDSGVIVLNQKGHESGLGCELDHDTLGRVLIERRDFK